VNVEIVSEIDRALRFCGRQGAYGGAVEEELDWLATRAEIGADSYLPNR
jgi:hypothetical protein